MHQACSDFGLTNSFNGLEEQFHLNQQGLKRGTDDTAEAIGSDRGRLTKPVQQISAVTSIELKQEKSHTRQGMSRTSTHFCLHATNGARQRGSKQRNVRVHSGRVGNVEQPRQEDGLRDGVD